MRAVPLILAALLATLPARAECPGGAGPGGAAGVCIDTSGLSHAAGTTVQDAVAALDTALGAACRGLEDEGVQLPSRPTLNFVGAGVTCDDDAAGEETDCTIPGGGHSIEDEGSALAARAVLNFVGPGIACSDDAGNGETDCSVPATALYLAGDTDPLVSEAVGTVILDPNVDGTGEYVFGGSTSIVKGFTANVDATGSPEFQVSGTGGLNVRIRTCVRIGSVNATAALVCRDGTGDTARLFYDLDADQTKDVAEQDLTARLSTSDPVDGSDACSTGDRWLNTSTRKLFYCTDGATDDWWGRRARGLTVRARRIAELNQDRAART